MTNIEVFMLGRFVILVDGVDVVPLLGNSKKKLSILQYLILNKNESISNSVLYESIWPGEDSTNPESSLKTLISRLRQNLKDAGIGNTVVTKQWSYRWNDDLGAEIDVFRLEELCQKVKDVKELTPENSAAFQEIIKLYQGDLLLGYDTETWIVPKSMYYHDLYINSLYTYIELLQAEQKHIEIIQATRKGLEADRFDPKLNLALMTSLLEQGMKNEAMSHYNYTVNLHYTQLGVTPSNDILSFYKELEQVDHDSTANLDKICKDLCSGEEDSCAFVCDYSIFKDVYELNMRNLERLNVTMFLGLITITSSSDSAPTNMLLLDKVMDHLIDSLKRNLRKGDTISRYTPSQIAILLPTNSHKAATTAMERVKNAFYSTHTIPDFVISYKIKPI